MNCTCGATDAGGGPDDHAAGCRVRTGFYPNEEPPHGVANPRYALARHRRLSRLATLRLRRPTVVGLLNAFGLGGFVVAGGMLHPIAGVAIFGVACIVFGWLVSDDG